MTTDTSPTCLARALSRLAAIALVAGNAATAEQPASAYDRVWRHAILYRGTEAGGAVSSVALSGRLQADAVRFDAGQGEFDDLRWRRFRFGFTSELAGDWVAQVEGDFDLNESADDGYTRLTDAYLGWQPGKELDLRLFKHSAGFTLDGATSSKELLTLERNNLTNNLWFPEEYFTGVSAKGSPDGRLAYRAGVFSGDGDAEIGVSEGSYFLLTSLGYDWAGDPGVDAALLRLDYVHNDEDEDNNTRDLSDVLSLTAQWQRGPWGLWADLAAGSGYFDQSDLWGICLMPLYNSSELLQWVARYTYLRSDDDNGLRLNRYESEIVGGRGDAYKEFYAGVNLFFYGHKLKWQTGLQYTVMDDAADDGGEYDGWGLATGLRVYW